MQLGAQMLKVSEKGKNIGLRPSEFISDSNQGYAQCKQFHSSTCKVSHTQTSLCFRQQERKEGGEEDTSKGETFSSMSLKINSKE